MLCLCAVAKSCFNKIIIAGSSSDRRQGMEAAKESYGVPQRHMCVPTGSQRAVGMPGGPRGYWPRGTGWGQGFTGRPGQGGGESTPLWHFAS